MGALIDAVSFFAASPGSGTFVFGQARPSFLTLTQAVADNVLVDGQTVSYLAQDSASSPVQREWGHGTYSQAGNSIARTQVLGSVNNGVAGGMSAISFTQAPMVSLTALAEDFALQSVTQDQTFYVATTGSDSNPGTQALPFKTIDQAMNIANNLNWQGNALTVNVAAGTYVEAHGLFLTNFFNGGPGTLVGDTVTPTNVIIRRTNGNLISSNGNNATWTITGFELDSNSVLMGCAQGGNVVFRHITANDSSASGTMTLAAATGISQIQTAFQTITFLTNSFASYATVGTGSFVTFFGCTMVLVANTTYTSQDSISNFSLLGFDNNTVTNSGTAHAGGLNMSDYSEWSTTNGLLSNYPSTSPTFTADGTCAIRVSSNIGSNTQTFLDQVNSGLPSTTTLSPGMWAIIKDSSGGGVYLATNDGGTIKKVALT